MATRRRKQIAYVPLSKNFPEILETHWTGKTTKKRQNFKASTSPAHT
jgi:hypothetical protein